jgi:hypothetical protein
LVIGARSSVLCVSERDAERQKHQPPNQRDVSQRVVEQLAGPTGKIAGDIRWATGNSFSVMMKIVGTAKLHVILLLQCAYGLALLFIPAIACHQFLVCESGLIAALIERHRGARLRCLMIFVVKSQADDFANNQ